MVSMCGREDGGRQMGMGSMAGKGKRETEGGEEQELGRENYETKRHGSFPCLMLKRLCLLCRPVRTKSLPNKQP